MSRESFRRTLRGKGPARLRPHAPKMREGKILSVSKCPVTTMAPTTPIYKGIQTMAKEGFRRIPISDPGTQVLKGIITASDIVDYLGGGKRFEIIEKRFSGNMFEAFREPIRTIMVREVVSVRTSAEIGDAIELMIVKRVGGLPVVDEKRRVKAIITERDILNMFADKISGVEVAELMSDRVVAAIPTTSILEASRTMTVQGLRRLLIISENRVKGIVTTMDILRFFGSGKAFSHLRSDSLVQVLDTPAWKIATASVSTVEPKVDVGQAAKMMQDKNCGALPVVEDGKLVGIVTERDLLEALA